MKANPKTISLPSVNGKVLPNATDLEEAILGAILTERTAYARVEGLNPDDFYKIAHERIFLAMKNMNDKGQGIDIFTVTEELRRMGELENIGGSYAITKLSVQMSSAAYIEQHAAIVKQKSIARKLITMAGATLEMAYDSETDVGDVMEFVELQFTNISNGSSDIQISSMEEALQETIDYMQLTEINKKSGKCVAIPTGLGGLNKKLGGGWKSPDLIIVGARPSMGKSQLAVLFAESAGLENQNVLFDSIEMTKIQIIIRMITESPDLDADAIRLGELTAKDWEEVDKMIGKLDKLPISFIDTPQIANLSNIKSSARSMKRKGKLDLLIIDYLQLIETGLKFGTRDLEIGYITRSLKMLAKELHIPIILLAQLKRPAEGTIAPPPKMSDLRESGNIEQDADTIILIHRPSYYDPEAVEEEGGKSWHNRGGLIIAKQREGERGIWVIFKHDDTFKRIWDDYGYDPSDIGENNSFYEQVGG